MRGEHDRDRFSRDDDSLLSAERRRRTGAMTVMSATVRTYSPIAEPDRHPYDHEYLLQQQLMYSKSSPLNELVAFKKELEKSERQREQLSDHLEVFPFSLALPSLTCFLHV